MSHGTKIVALFCIMSFSAIASAMSGPYQKIISTYKALIDDQSSWGTMVKKIKYGENWVTFEYANHMKMFLTFTKYRSNMLISTIYTMPGLPSYLIIRNGKEIMDSRLLSIQDSSNRALAASENYSQSSSSAAPVYSMSALASRSAAAVTGSDETTSMETSGIVAQLPAHPTDQTTLDSQPSPSEPTATAPERATRWRFVPIAPQVVPAETSGTIAELPEHADQSQQVAPPPPSDPEDTPVPSCGQCACVAARAQ